MHPPPLRGAGWRALAAGVDVLSHLARIALAVMILATGLDVLLRLAGIALPGAYDVVRLCGATALSCALPATTAAKGHIAIEYFFHKLNRRGRVLVDTLVHGGVLAVFALAAAQCLTAGRTFLRTGEVTPTLQIPLFWVPWVMAVGCVLAALVSLFHLLHPGREMIKP